MNVFLAIFLGLLQGLTEFLPVSSSGHLMAAQKLFNLPENMLLFNIILHLATLCAIIIVFRKKILELIKNPFCKTNICLLIATVITCSMVVIFKDLIDKTFTYKILPVTFMLTAIVLFATNFAKERNILNTNESISYPQSAAAGFAQGIAVIPGLSRSGSTIAACLLTGVKRESSAEFSFLMSIPIIIASFVYELISNPAPLAISVLPLVCAFVAALLSGIVAIKIMLDIVKKVKLYWFSMYLTALAIILVFLF